MIPVYMMDMYNLVCDGMGILKEPYSFAFLNLRLTAVPASPSSPIPMRIKVEGSGTGAGVAVQLGDEREPTDVPPS